MFQTTNQLCIQQKIRGGFHEHIERTPLVSRCGFLQDPIWGVSMDGDHPNSWMVYTGKSQSKMDDNWRFPDLRKATYAFFKNKNIREKKKKLTTQAAPKSADNRKSFRCCRHTCSTGLQGPFWVEDHLQL